METNKNLEFLVSFILLDSTLDWFEFVKVTEEPIEPKKDAADHPEGRIMDGADFQRPPSPRSRACRGAPRKK